MNVNASAAAIAMPIAPATCTQLPGRTTPQ